MDKGLDLPAISPVYTSTKVNWILAARQTSPEEKPF